MDSRNTTCKRRAARNDVFWAIAVAAAVAVVYAPTVSFEFVDYDDYIHVVSNRLVHPPTVRGVLDAWREPYCNVYIPLAYTVYAAEAWLAQDVDAPHGLDAGIFHAGNMLLHAGCAVLVFFLLRRLSLNAAAAVVGALCFAWHPFQVESVAWVSGLPGLLSAVFALAALWQYVVYAQLVTDGAGAMSHGAKGNRRPTGGASGSTARWHYAAATFFLLLALLAKPLAAAVPLVAGVVAVGWLGRRWSLVLRDLWPWLVMAGVLTLLTKWQQPTELVVNRVGLVERVVVAADAIVFYAIKLLVPLGMTPDYGRTPTVAIDGWTGYGALLGLLAVVAVGWRVGLSRKVWTAAGVAIVALSPVLGLIPFGHQNISTVADRYMYLAMFGVALLAAYGWSVARYRGRWALAAAVLVLWAVRTLDQSRHWHDSIALARHSLEVQPASAVMHIAWAKALERRGQQAEALEHYRQAAAARPEAPSAHHQLGEALIRRGRFAEAEAPLKKALRLSPGFLPAREALARSYERQGQLQRAIDEYRRLLEAAPQSLGPRLSIARLLLEEGRAEEAMEQYHRLRREVPGNAEVLLALARAHLRQQDAQQARAYVDVARRVVVSAAEWQELGSIQLSLGDLEAAAESFARAVALDPQRAEAKNNLAILRRSQGRLDEARRLLESAVKLRPEAANFHTNLGATLLDLGRADEGMRELQAALEIDPHYADAHILLGTLLERRGQAEAALRHFMAAVEQQPSNAQLHNHVGVMLAQTGRWHEAIHHFSRAVQLAPDNREAKANLNEAQRQLREGGSP